MGRKRLPPELKRATLHITLPKQLIDKLKEKNINISHLIEIIISDYLELEPLIDIIKEENGENLTQFYTELLKKHLNKK
jgi:post-segregation antitoxin (ccd killing protein)